MSDSVRPHRQQPTRLRRLWDSPGKNTGVGCHFLLRCTKVKSESEVAQLCRTLSDPMDWSPPGSSVHGIFQARTPRIAKIFAWSLSFLRVFWGNEPSQDWLLAVFLPQPSIHPSSWLQLCRSYSLPSKFLTNHLTIILKLKKERVAVRIINTGLP